MFVGYLVYVEVVEVLFDWLYGTVYHMVPVRYVIGVCVGFVVASKEIP